jgi:cation transport regulator ChaC
MPRGTEGMASRVRPELVDELMGAYVDWREECLALDNAYERWSNVPLDERNIAFAAYRAALDREEQASSVYAERTHLVAEELERSRKPLRWLRTRARRQRVPASAAAAASSRNGS